MHLQSFGNADSRRFVFPFRRVTIGYFSLGRLEPIMLRRSVAMAKVEIFDNKV